MSIHRQPSVLVSKQVSTSLTLACFTLELGCHPFQLGQAILTKAREITSWPGLNGAADALAKTIYTNLSLTDLMLFSLHMHTTHAVHVGLSISNILVYAESANGQSILLPANGDWSAFGQYLQQHRKP